MKQLEAAEEQLSRITPDSEEYEQLANRVNTIQWWVISAARAIAPEKFDSSQDESASLQSNNGPLSTSPTDAFLVADGGPNTSVLPTNVHPSTINPTDSIDAQLEAALAQLDSIVTTETDIKNQLLINATDLQEEQTAIIERFNVILNALEQKGGNVVSYRTYIDAISGIQLDLTDTQGMGIRLVGWIKSQDGGIRFVFSLLKFGGIICIATLVSPRLGKVSDTVLRQVDGVSALLRSFIVKLIKRGSFSAGMLLALASLGVNLGPVLALVGGASFVVAFALQSNLGNFASGLMLMVNKPFDVGDEVKIAGYWAFVHSISLANTKLKDWDGNLVTLPNNTVWGGDITNYTHRKIRKLKFGIHILLDQDIDYIRDMWFDVALSHPKVLQDPGPGIRPWNETYDYRIWIGLGAWTKTEDYWEVYLDLLKALQKRLELEGLELAATPVSDVNLLNLAETPSASLRAMAYAAKTEPDNAPVEVVIS
ncbi:MAG: mechanosensitive ion channel family protein [Leptolyngbyaceae cyanobacterium]